MKTALHVLAHPLPLTAGFVLALNDHVLKHAGALPAALTGKLSDVAGLFVFTVLLIALTPSRSRAWAWGLGGAVAVGFAAVNLWAPANEWIAPLWHLTMDPTDLVTLPAAGFGAAWAHRRGARPQCGRRPLQWALVASLSLACVATSPPRYPRTYPTWQVAQRVAHDGVHSVALADGGRLDLWVSRSGREGLGVTVLGSGVDRLELQTATVTTAFGPAAGRVTTGDMEDMVYVLFAFDNDTLWRREHDDAVLVLLVTADTVEQRIELPLEQVIASARP